MNSNLGYTIYKSYLEESCSSFEINVKPLTKTKINFVEHLSKGTNNYNPSFMITEIPTSQHIKIFCNDIKVIPGNKIYNNSGLFYLIAEDTYSKYIFKFRHSRNNNSCYMIVNIIYNEIKIKDNSYRCNKASNRIKINNIIDIDLDKTLDISINQIIDFNIEFMNIPENEDLIYRYSNI